MLMSLSIVLQYVIGLSLCQKYPKHPYKYIRLQLIYPMKRFKQIINFLASLHNAEVCILFLKYNLSVICYKE